MKPALLLTLSSSVLAGHAERPLENITVTGLRVRLLPENRPGNRAAHALVIERVAGLTVRNVEVEWDQQAPNPPGAAPWSCVT